MDDVMSTVYCHPENLNPESPAVFIVSSSWEDFLEQVASSFNFTQHSCILSTEAGVLVNNYRALRALSQGQTKLLLKGTLLSTLENPVVHPAAIPAFSSSEKQTTNTKDGATPSTSSSTPSPKSPNCSEDTDIASSPRSPNAAQPYSNTIDASVSPSNSSSNQVDEDLRQTSSDGESTDLTNKEFYPVPEILHQMRATQGQNKLTKSARDLIKDLKIADPSYNDIKLMRKAVTWWLMLHCAEKYFPSRAEYIKMSKSIVKYFPHTGNARSDLPWDIFFDPKTGLSQLDCYARNKRSRDGLARPQVNHHNKRRKMSSVQPQECSEMEIKDAEMYMRQNVISPQNREKMIECFKITRPVRISLLDDKSKSAVYILKRFPLLVEMLEAVDDDLMYLKKTSVATFLLNWRKVGQQLIDLSQKKFKSASETDLIERIGQAMDNYDSVEYNRLLVILLARLLSSSSGQRNNKEGVDLSASGNSIVSSMFQLFENGTSILEATQTADSANMQDLGLLMIGSKYFIKCQDFVFELHVKLFDEALGYLVAYFYVLHLNYPKQTKFILSFLERIFGMGPSVQSRAVTTLLNSLKF